MRIILSTIALIIYLPLASQSLSGKSFLQSFELSIGTKAKVTPIYFEGPYDFIFLFIPNIQQQPDAHLSGFGSFFLEEHFAFSSKFSVSLHQTIRKDFLVTHIPFGLNNEMEKRGDEKRFFYDLYAHLKYTIPSNKKANFILIAGGGFSGLNSGHEVTFRKYNQTGYTDKTFHDDFIYTVVQTGFEWQRHRINAGLLIGYCWKNPTWYESKFLLPEISIRYKIFSSKKDE